MKRLYISRSRYTVFDGIAQGFAFIIDGLVLVLSFGQLNSWFSCEMTTRRLIRTSRKLKCKRPAYHIMAEKYKENKTWPS